MSIVLTDALADHLAQEYATTHVSVISLSIRAGVPYHGLLRAFQARGIVPTGNAANLPVDEVVAEYHAGALVAHLADRYGVKRTTISRLLGKAGVVRRSRGETKKLELARMNALRPGYTDAISRAAHDAARGRRASKDELRARATGWEAAGRRQKYVADVAAIMRQAGLECIEELAVDSNNLDIGIPALRVAVEVQSFMHRGENSSIRRERIEPLLDGGWAILAVYIASPKPPPDLHAIAHKAIAFAYLAGGNEAMHGQYGMIGRYGEPYTPVKFEMYNRPRVPGF